MRTKKLGNQKKEGKLGKYVHITYLYINFGGKIGKYETLF
jgi:hypothetical protein